MSPLKKRSSEIKCFKCLRRGHIAFQCLTKKTMLLKEDERLWVILLQIMFHLVMKRSIKRKKDHKEICSWCEGCWAAKQRTWMKAKGKIIFTQGASSMERYVLWSLMVGVALMWLVQTWFQNWIWRLNHTQGLTNFNDLVKMVRWPWTSKLKWGFPLGNMKMMFCVLWSLMVGAALMWLHY